MIRFRCGKCGTVLAETVMLKEGISLPLYCPNCGAKINKDLRKSEMPIRNG